MMFENYVNLSMTYPQALDFLYSRLPAYHRIGKAAYKNDLHNTLALDDYFDHPHRRFKTIHIAGTNGKGSTSHMIASVLQEAGYKTGLYTSPHLKDFRERIRIDGEMIGEEDVTRFVVQHMDIIEKISPSFFELTVAMAFDHFARSGVDVAVIEAGLGGRLDSTNIIQPVLSLITNIGHDHMDLLGDTLEKIAYEKAGIIKKNVPVVISESNPLTRNVFLERAHACGSDIVFADERFECLLGESSGSDGERKYIITAVGSKKQYEGITVLGGDYQQANLKAVYAVFDMLFDSFKYNNGNIIDGIRNVINSTGLMGRWQILGKNPLTICDTGHNKEGLEYVMKQINRLNVSSLHLVIGFVKDKDLDTVLPLFPRNAIYYFTRATVDRALDPELLKAAAANYGLVGTTFPNVKSAVAAARNNAGPFDLVFIGGSNFVVAEVL
jgi:dihydrofolate synthase / folylpolyglutamate synthase